jgi:hypothetical protein
MFSRQRSRPFGPIASDDELHRAFIQERSLDAAVSFGGQSQRETSDRRRLLSPHRDGLPTMGFAQASIY